MRQRQRVSHSSSRPHWARTADSEVVRYDAICARQWQPLIKALHKSNATAQVRVGPGTDASESAVGRRAGVTASTDSRRKASEGLLPCKLPLTGAQSPGRAPS